MNCEMCGSPGPTSRVLVEGGAVLNLCTRCERFGRVVRAPRAAPAVHRDRTGGRGVRTGAAPPRYGEVDPLDRMEGGLELREDYPRLIRDARARSGLTQEQLGRKINEKRSVIQQLEAGDIHPDARLVKKLERALSIRLMERVDM